LGENEPVKGGPAELVDQPTLVHQPEGIVACKGNQGAIYTDLPDFDVGVLELCFKE
jgi:hypothetical protein